MENPCHVQIRCPLIHVYLCLEVTFHLTTCYSPHLSIPQSFVLLSRVIIDLSLLPSESPHLS